MYHANPMLNRLGEQVPSGDNRFHPCTRVGIPECFRMSLLPLFPPALLNLSLVRRILNLGTTLPPVTLAAIPSLMVPFDHHSHHSSRPGVLSLLAW